MRRNEPSREGKKDVEERSKWWRMKAHHTKWKKIELNKHFIGEDN